jgi:hypothetical protein
VGCFLGTYGPLGSDRLGGRQSGFLGSLDSSSAPEVFAAIETCGCQRGRRNLGRPAVRRYSALVIFNQAPPLRIRLLGGFRVERDGLPVLERWRRPGAQTLVKLLAVEPGHRMHREQVREICRPGASRQAAMSSLRVALHTARHALQPELRPREESAYLLLEGELLALSRTLVTVDVDETEALALAAGAGAGAGVGVTAGEGEGEGEGEASARGWSWSGPWATGLFPQ